MQEPNRIRKFLDKRHLEWKKEGWPEVYCCECNVMDPGYNGAEERLIPVYRRHLIVQWIHPSCKLLKEAELKTLKELLDNVNQFGTVKKSRQSSLSMPVLQSHQIHSNRSSARRKKSLSKN